MHNMHHKSGTPWNLMSANKVHKVILQSALQANVELCGVPFGWIGCYYCITTATPEAHDVLKCINFPLIICMHVVCLKALLVLLPQAHKMHFV